MAAADFELEYEQLMEEKILLKSKIKDAEGEIDDAKALLEKKAERREELVLEKDAVDAKLQVARQLGITKDLLLLTHTAGFASVGTIR